MLEFTILTVLPGAVAFAAAMDLFTLTIPNRVCAILALAFFPLAWLAGLELSDIAYHLGAGLAVLCIGILLFIPGWFGGGDAKLMAAIALWVGFHDLALYFVYVALAGGMLATVFSAMRAVPLPRPLLCEAWAWRLHRPDGGIPYGIALAAGALAVFPQTVWFTSLAG